jgi:hypothetical protein
MEINKNAIISKSTGLLEAPMDDSLALMSIESGKYYGLNSIGRAIWENIEEEKSFQDIVTSLINRFEIDEITCEEQCKEFIKELKQRNMIEIV